MNPSCVHIDNLSKQYKGASTYSLDKVNLDILQGDIYGILGPNGAGKTTLISILCGILKHSSGSFSYDINGRSLSDKSLKQHIGYVPQDYAFYEELTPIQNLQFFGAMYNLSKPEVKSQTEKLLDILGLKNVANKKIEEFSGGMKRRINLAIGMLHKPAILFLDEPTVGVDVQSKRAILTFLKEENVRGTTVIYSSHNMKDAEEFCSSFALIDFGKILVSGPLDFLLKNENINSLEEYFINKTGESYRD